MAKNKVKIVGLISLLSLGAIASYACLGNKMTIKPASSNSKYMTGIIYTRQQRMRVHKSSVKKLNDGVTIPINIPNENELDIDFSSINKEIGFEFIIQNLTNMTFRLSVKPVFDAYKLILNDNMEFTSPSVSGVFVGFSFYNVANITSMKFIVSTPMMTNADCVDEVEFSFYCA